MLVGSASKLNTVHEVLILGICGPRGGIESMYNMYMHRGRGKQLKKVQEKKKQYSELSRASGPQIADASIMHLQ